MSISDTTPIIVGVGQASERVGEPGYAELSHMDLAGAALNAAFADSGATGDLGAALDTIAAIRQFEISATRYSAPFGHSTNTPRSIARRAGADPQRAILEVVGGQGPQKLVGELAADIAAGRSKLAAIVGSEAISTLRSLLSRGETRDWSEDQPGSLEDRGTGYDGVLDTTALKHGVAAPIAAYPLAENVRRERLGLSLQDYRLEIGKLFAPFTEVAERNPHSAAPTARTAEDLATITERNRLVAEPYGRLVVARDQVNQGAAIVLASVGEARRLGVPEDRWVYIHSVADCAEPSMLTRENLEKSPAAVAAISTALEVAGKGWDDLCHIDFYSCFAIPVLNLLDSFGLDRDDHRGWTLTGGLPFFGGAGNNYSAHAIAEAVARCRAEPGSFALVGANGGNMSKYAAAVYSTQPAKWPESRWHHLDKIAPAFEVLDSHDGDASLETFTIQPGKEGEVATIVARVGSARVLGNSRDPGVIETLRSGLVAGRTVRIESGEKGVNSAWFT